MRNKNAIIIWLIINIFVAIILISLVIFYFIPSIFSIEDEKKDLWKLKVSYNLLIKRWLNYKDFKSMHSPNTTTYQKKILLKISPEFYNKYFINSGTGENDKLYKDFLNNLDEQLKGEVKDKYDKKQKEILNILPIYTENDSVNQWWMSDFKFINNIEDLLYKYNLTTDSPIGIKDIKKVKEYSNTHNMNSDLWADIYVINLPLSIEGKKKDIIDFLQEIYKKWYLAKEFNKKTWEYTLKIMNSSQFVELSSIEMDKYIDNSPSVNAENKNKNLIDVLETTYQKNQDFKLDINLLFYVQWLPNYKIKETILNILWNIKKTVNKNELEKLQKTNYLYLKQRVSKLLIKNKKDQLKLRQLNEMDMYLKWISKDILSIVKNTQLNKDLLKNYNRTINYKSIFEIISKKLDSFEK